MNYLKRHHPAVLISALFLALGPGLPVFARLPGIAFEDFRRLSPCGFVVEVEAVEVDQDYMRELEAALLQGKSAKVKPSVKASMVVLGGFGPHDGCACSSRQFPGCSFSMHFLSSAEASEPSEGDRAVVFPKCVEGQWRESVFGRSYWRLEPGPEKNIQVTWRNRFLEEAFEVTTVSRGRFKRLGLLELHHIVDAWGGEKPCIKEICDLSAKDE